MVCPPVAVCVEVERLAQGVHDLFVLARIHTPYLLDTKAVRLEIPALTQFEVADGLLRQGAVRALSQERSPESELYTWFERVLHPPSPVEADFVRAHPEDSLAVWTVHETGPSEARVDLDAQFFCDGRDTGEEEGDDVGALASWPFAGAGGCGGSGSR